MIRRDIIVIATSTGGLDALKQLLVVMPADLPASIFVVMHIGAHESILPAILQKSCLLPVRHAKDGEAFIGSVIYIAPPDRHLLLSDGKMLLSSGPKENFSRPAADPLFRSAAVTYGSRVIGVVLTGELDDGAAGLKAIAACGGFTIVQDPADCRSPSMPTNAMNALCVDVVAPIGAIADAIVSALEPTMSQVKADLKADVFAAKTEERMMRTGHFDLPSLDSIGVRSSLTCPDCGGVVWRIGKGSPLRYRCHTGHAFSALVLADQQRKQSENAVWQVIRGIEERMFLAKERLENQRSAGRDISEFLAHVATLEAARVTALSILHIGHQDTT